jgi:hypothetical protein
MQHRDSDSTRATRIAPIGPDTCSLDIAERGEHTLEQVGDLLGLTRERARQLEEKALRKLRFAMRVRGLSFDDLSLRIRVDQDLYGGAPIERDASTETVERKCKACGTLFFRQANRMQTYCSQKCVTKNYSRIAYGTRRAAK